MCFLCTNKFRKHYTHFEFFQFLIGKNELRGAPDETSLDKFYNEDEISPYYVNGPDSPYINMVSAISLLTNYCNTFVGDPYTTFSPNWYINNNHENSMKSVIIELPTPCPILDPIEVKTMTFKVTCC